MEQQNRKKCFVLMPFKTELEEIYSDVYKPTCLENNIDCWRVDEISRPGSITRDIIEGILDSDLIIADLTSKNPNVFYELGIAHSTSNKTIMTAQKKEDVPFDIASYRVIFYDHTLKGCKKLQISLDKAIKELLVVLDRTNNPFQEVIAARGITRIKGKTPLIKTIEWRRLSPRLKSLFEKEKIIYLEDIRKLNLMKLMSEEGFGKESLAQLCTIILEHELYDDLGSLHKLIVDNKVDVKNNRLARREL